MSPQAIGALSTLFLVVLIFLRVPVAVALLTTALVGLAAIDGWYIALVTLANTPFDLAQNYSLSVVPLFLLMGAVAAHTSLARDLFDAANAVVGARRGGLAMASVTACAGFGAICGSSLATAATMTKITVPEMRRYGYANDIAAGVLASGGTLGVLIPPSIILVVYAIVAEQSVPALFAAALVPGILVTLIHIVAIGILAKLRPADLPASPPVSWPERWRAVLRTWKVALLFGVSVVGIYAGWFSPTEAAAVGAFLAFVIAFAARELDGPKISAVTRETLLTTGSLFFIVIGAFAYGYLIAQTKIPASLGEWIVAQQLAPALVIAFIVLVYVVLGCFLDSISMMLVTVPVFLPIAQSLGFSPVWFGVLVVIVAEIGMITPPVGLNLFVIRAQVPDIPLTDLYRGIVPFVIVYLVSIALLTMFPGLALWLPNWLGT